MNYRVLPENLVSTADIVYNYLTKVIGLSKVQVESSIDVEIDYRPTFYAITRDYHIYCVDVSENIYNPTRWNFISDCEHNIRSVKFYIALPSLEFTGFSSELKKAKDAGIGIFEVSTQKNHCHPISSALPLSLCGLRKFDKAIFPKRYKETLVNAEETYRNGEPNQACSMIYGEIELLTRKTAYRAHKKGDFNQPIANPETLLGKMSWASVLKQLSTSLKRSGSSKYATLTDDMIARTQGITGHRNQSNHKPNSLKTRMQRDSQLRTRMETAVDLLLELANATKSLRIQ